MRALSVALMLATTLALPSLATAGNSRHDLGTITVNPRVEKASIRGTYRGQYYDMSSIRDRTDVPELVDALRHQIDDVQNLKLTPRVLGFFQSVPVVVDDFACLGHMTSPEKGESKPAMDAACYGHQIPATTKVGINPSPWGSDATSRIAESDPLSGTRTTGINLLRPIPLTDRNKKRPT